MTIAIDQVTVYHAGGVADRSSVKRRQKNIAQDGLQVVHGGFY